MSKWRKVKATPLPRTLVGQWLLAAVLEQRDLRDRLVKSLNGGQGGWNNDEPAVIAAACQLLASSSLMAPTPSKSPHSSPECGSCFLPAILTPDLPGKRKPKP